MENYLNPDNREFRVIANTYGKDSNLNNQTGKKL